MDKDKISIEITIGTLYFVSVAVLYLWGYWGSFGINILEYLTLGDIVKLSAYPVIPSFIFITSSVILHQIYRYYFPIRERLSDKEIKIIFFKIMLSNFLLYLMLLPFIIIVIFGSFETKWLMIPTYVGIYISPFLENSVFLKFISEKRLRDTIYFLFLALPIFSLGQGKIISHNIKEGKQYQYLYVKSLDKKSTPTNSEDKLKYLGYANQYIFLMTMDNKTILIKNIDKIDDFEIHTYRKSDEKKPEEKPKEQPK